MCRITLVHWPSKSNNIIIFCQYAGWLSWFNGKVCSCWQRKAERQFIPIMISPHNISNPTRLTSLSAFFSSFSSIGLLLFILPPEPGIWNDSVTCIYQFTTASQICLYTHTHTFVSTTAASHIYNAALLTRLQCIYFYSYRNKERIYISDPHNNFIFIIQLKHIQVIFLVMLSFRPPQHLLFYNSPKHWGV